MRIPPSTTGCRRAAAPSSSQPKLPSPKGVVGSAVMFSVLGAVAQAAQIPGLRKLVPAYAASVLVDAVELVDG